MGFLSFAGRALFAFFFLYSAWREYALKSDRELDVCRMVATGRVLYGPLIAEFSGMSYPDAEVFNILRTSSCQLTPINRFRAFGVDGGPTAEALRPTVNLFRDHLNSNLGLPLPAVEIKHVIAAGIALKGTGAILFILGSSVGAYLLLLHLATTTPLLHDFNRYNEPEFLQSFTQDLAFVGTLLYYLGMKNSIRIRHSKKRPRKAKTV